MVAARRNGFAIFAAILLASFTLGYLLGRYGHVPRTGACPTCTANPQQAVTYTPPSPPHVVPESSHAVQESASLQPQPQSPPPGGDSGKPKAEAPTLVVYTFALTDDMSIGNLRFFLSRAVVEDDGVFYTIVINLEEGQRMSSLRLPRLPSNAIYVPHKNECYDWGTYAWALTNVPQVDVKKYKYFIFINSSARGPFMHPSLEAHFHWTSLFTSALNNDTKLVGPTISCGGFCWKRPGATAKECQKHPHVQSVAVATDQVGLKVLQDSGRVLRCHEDRNSAVFDGEMGASRELLRAGFNIASFLVRYKGIDFRHERTQKCNGGTSPLGVHSFDGLTPGALELVFPKVKQSLVESGLATHLEALKMSMWIMQPAYKRAVGANAANRDLRQRAEDVLVAKAKGIECFDMDFYRAKNPDLAARYSDPRDIFNHFLVKGMLDYREHKWTCGLNATDIIPKFP